MSVGRVSVGIAEEKRWPGERMHHPKEKKAEHGQGADSSRIYLVALRLRPGSWCVHVTFPWLICETSVCSEVTCFIQFSGFCLPFAFFFLLLSYPSGQYF